MKTEAKAKPPIGIEPKRIWQEKRLQELLKAIQRYKDAMIAVPHEWNEEALNLFVELTK